MLLSKFNNLIYYMHDIWFYVILNKSKELHQKGDYREYRLPS